MKKNYKALNSGFSLLYPELKMNILVDGKPSNNFIFVYVRGRMTAAYTGRSSEGSFRASYLPQKYQNSELYIILVENDRPFASSFNTPDHVVVYDVAINTSGGGGAPTGNPGTIAGKVERALDGQIEPAARTLVAVENKPDGTWAVTGNAASDGETGDYTLNVLTDGGDTFIVAIDDYGRKFVATATVEQNEIIHPITPNGYVYRVEVPGTLPDTEPEWWIDTGTNNTRTVGSVTLRAMPYYRPLCHGPLKADQG